MQEPVQPLSILKVRPIGILPMTDDGEEDENVICIHADDPQYQVYEDVQDLVRHRLREMSHFFADYKSLEGKEVEVGEIAGPDAAVKAIRQAMDRYAEKFPEKGS